MLQSLQFFTQSPGLGLELEQDHTVSTGETQSRINMDQDSPAGLGPGLDPGLALRSGCGLAGLEGSAPGS